MAITTLAGVRSGQQFPRPFVKASTGGAVGRPKTFWAQPGNPPAGSYNATLNGVALSSPVTGQINFVDPASGSAYLARLGMCHPEECTVILADRLWHNGGYTITSTSAQNSTTPTWPARDANGSTNGEGVFLGLEISASTGAGTPTVTVTYTNSAGTGSRTATNIIATVATALGGSVFPIGLQTGDLGVRSVQSLQLSATWTSGTMNLVAFREIARLEVTSRGEMNWIDAVTGCRPTLYNSSVPYIMVIPLSTTSMNISGHVEWTHG